MKSAKFIFSIIGFFVGAFIVKSFFLTTGEEFYLRAWLENISGGFSGKLGGLYMRHAGNPIGLFVKLGLGAGLGAVFVPMAIQFLKNEVSKENLIVDSNKKKKCPECAEFVLEDAKVCRYCNHKFIV